MKAFILEKIARRINSYKFVKRALRVDENLILMQFDNEKYYFDLTKGKGDIYIDIDYPLVKKFKAPFDIVLEKKFTKSEIVEAKAFERILTITVRSKNRFKEEIVKIRFEFTGRYTNAIILDKEDMIIESLRHITENISSRVVKPGVKLPLLEKREIKEEVFEIDDLVKYTEELFAKKYNERLNQKKSSLLNKIEKKLNELRRKLDSLESEEKLIEKSQKYKKYADVAMANLHLIKPYQKVLKTHDFEGEELEIPLPPLKNINQIGNYYYRLSKKAKKKAENLHIEKKHLTQRLEFLENYKKLILKAKNLSDLKTYSIPKKEKKEDENVAKFYFDDYMILVGKNESGNIKLLKSSSANDLWVHIKNRPGAHVIVKNNKLSLNDDIIKKAAQMAVAFSGQEEGEVDYTKRKFVKVKEGAKVEYGKYNTIKVRL